MYLLTLGCFLIGDICFVCLCSIYQLDNNFCKVSEDLFLMLCDYFSLQQLRKLVRLLCLVTRHFHFTDLEADK